MNEIADSKGRSLAMGKAYEEKHVHKVYQQIAQHFSSTRYKACNNCCLRKKNPNAIFAKHWYFTAMAHCGKISWEVGTRVCWFRYWMW
jgi:hypothetical protein